MGTTTGFLKLISPALVLSSLSIPLASYAGDSLPGKKPIIESIEGSKSIELTQGSRIRKISAGGEINYGEKMKTGNSTVTIRYSDSSKIIVSDHSNFTVEVPARGTQLVQLLDGSARGLITKVVQTKSQRPKFIFHTNSITFGIRGTDFIVIANSTTGASQVYLLEGALEVARNNVSLLKGEGIALQEGQSIESTSTGLSTPKEFDKSVYLKSIPPGLTLKAERGTTPGSPDKFTIEEVLPDKESVKIPTSTPSKGTTDSTSNEAPKINEYTDKADDLKRQYENKHHPQPSSVP